MILSFRPTYFATGCGASGQARQTVRDRVAAAPAAAAASVECATRVMPVLTFAAALAQAPSELAAVEAHAVARVVCAPWSHRGHPRLQLEWAWLEMQCAELVTALRLRRLAEAAHLHWGSCWSASSSAHLTSYRSCTGLAGRAVGCAAVGLATRCSGQPQRRGGTRAVAQIERLGGAASTRARLHEATADFAPRCVARAVTQRSSRTFLVGPDAGPARPRESN